MMDAARRSRQSTRRRRSLGAALAVGLGVALLLAGSGARAASAIEVRAEPARLQLGVDEGARLLIEAPGLARLQVTANVGTVEGLHAVAPGRFEATYRPPRPKYPQLAIVSAVGLDASGAVQGWSAIPLWGMGEAVIITKPRATISVRIGQEHFGPTRADALGRAKVPVRVPPGVREAWHEKKAVDLALPECSKLHLALAQPRLPADRDGAVDVFVYSVTDEGLPASDPLIELTTSRGAVELLGPVAPGVRRARWTLSRGATGHAQLTGKILGQPASRAAVPLELVVGELSRVELRTDRPTVTAGEERLLVVARLYDAAGNPSDGVVRVDADFGQVISSFEPERGRLETLFALPGQLQGKKEMLIRALEPSGRTVATQSVRLVPAAPATLRLAPERAQVVADGRTRLALQATLSDRFGNPVSVGAVRARATLGGALAGESAALTYQAPRLEFEQSDEVQVEADGLSALAAIQLLPPRAPLVLAPKLGILANSADGLTAYLGGEVGGRFAVAGQEFFAGVEAGTFRLAQTDTMEALGGPRALQGAHRVVPLLATLNWHRALGGPWEAWAGAGAGVSFIQSSLALEGEPRREESGAALTLQASLGACRRIWRGGPFAELRAWRLADPNLSTLGGALSGGLLSVGYRFEPL